MSGRLEVICGPMFSGKTEELIRRLRRAQIAGKYVRSFHPWVDDRYGEDISSHNGQSIPSTRISDPDLIVQLSLDVAVIGIDEAQFYEKGLVSQIQYLVHSCKKTVIVSGLDMTYRCEPFGIMPTLLALANSVTKLSAVCHRCGEDAYYTQRLIDGAPAPFSGDTVVIGGLDTYEARCQNCFEVG